MDYVVRVYSQFKRKITRLHELKDAELEGFPDQNFQYWLHLE